MRRSDLISSFTPSNMPPETLEAIFVQREPLARRITTSIRGAVRDGDIEHHIAVGPRGIGKTHLLSLVTFRVLADADLAGGLALAWLREEEWGVSSVGELYEQMISRLAADPENAPEVRRRAGEAADRLAGAAAEELADVAEAAIPAVLDGRVLVVVVENLDLLFQDIGTDDQHRLRAFLQNQRNTVLLASTPSLSQSIALRSGLFYGFFAIHHLGELTLEEARQMLVAIANLRADEEGQRLIAYLETDEAHRRLEVVGRLAGGHPRLWVLMAECITTERLEEIVGLLLAVLDDLTPYYQSQMKALTGQQRKIVMHLSRAEGAVAVRDVAAAVRIQERVAAKQLGDLTRLGYVRRAELPPGYAVTDRRTTPYEIREPLLRHVLEVKESRGRPLTLIVELLRAWFDRPKLEGWSTGEQPLAAVYARAALGPSRSNRDGDGADPSETKVDPDPRQRAEVANLLDEVSELLDRSAFAEALQVADRALALDSAQAVGHFRRGFALSGLGRVDDAIEAYDSAIALSPRHDAAHHNRALALDSLGRHEEAVAAWDKAIAIDPEYSDSHLGRGVSLAQLEQHAEAGAAFDRAIELDPTYASARFNRILSRIDETGSIVAKELETLLELAPDADFIADKLRWILLRSVGTEPSVGREIVEIAAKACSASDNLGALHQALASSLSIADSVPPQWIGAVSDALRHTEVEGPVVDLMAAVASYHETGNAAVLLQLPPELRELAYDLTDRNVRRSERTDRSDGVSRRVG